MVQLNSGGGKGQRATGDVPDKDGPCTEHDARAKDIPRVPALSRQVRTQVTPGLAQRGLHPQNHLCTS